MSIAMSEADLISKCQ